MGKNGGNGILTALAVTAEGGLLASSYIFFMQNLTRRKPNPDDPWNFTVDGKRMLILRKRTSEWIMRQKTEKVVMEADDGLELHATFLSNPGNTGNKRKVVLLSHGYGGTSVGDMGLFARYYYDKGFDMLFPDQRAHGKSAGKYITMGAWESTDLADWAKWICERCGEDCQILIHGWSMGAASAYLSIKYMPPQVRGMVFDCGYAAVADQFLHVGKNLTHMPEGLLKVIIFTMNFWTRLIAGYYLKESSPINDAEDLHLPVFFVHGDADDYVPCSSGMRLYAATKAPYKDKLVVKGAGHIMSYLYDKKGYEAGIDRLIENCMDD
jgi:fermentation-respiration switch protein FrsA (DUF1100 family)